MADFITVMTDAGLGLISDLIEDEDSIEFTSLVVGNGTYEASEKTFANLKTKTALKSLKETYAISMGERTSAEDVRLQSNIANYDPQSGQALFNEGFYVNEIGVMARPKSGGTAILFSISVTTQAQGDYLPHYEGTNPVEMVQDVLVKVSNQSTVTFNYTASAFALASNVAEEFFKTWYGLYGKTTVIDKDSQDHTRITETATDGTAATTIIVKTSQTVTTITTTIVSGDDTYVKTVTITKSSSGTTIVESYTQS